MRRGPAAIVLLLTAWIVSAQEVRAACVPGPNALCLLGRFRVEVIWRGPDGASTSAHAIPLPGTDGGAFWFFSQDNPELAVKVVDGRAVNGFFWFFYGGLTHLGYRINVTDTTSGAARIYEVPAGSPTSAADTISLPGTGSLQADLHAFAADELTALFEISSGPYKVDTPVHFSDRSTGSPDRWCWLFGDETGSGCSSEEPKTDHVYKTAGTKQIRLQVSRIDGPSLTFSEATESIQVDGVDSSPCVFKVSPLSHSFGPEGGEGSVKVETSDECVWTAKSDSHFIRRPLVTLTGSDTVTFEVDPNGSAEEQTGTLTVAGETVKVTQGAACSYQISPDHETFVRNGGEGAVIVAAPAGCEWTVDDVDAKFVTLEPGPKGGSGSGAVRYRVEPHPGTEPRTGTLTIAGSTFTIEQLPVDLAADFGFSPTPPQVGEAVTFFDQSAGDPDLWCWDFGDGTVLDCSPSQRTVTHTYSMAGTFNVRLEVRRSDPVTPLSAVKDKPVTVQAGGSSECAFAISPRLATFGPEGGTVSVAVTTSADCSWTAVSDTPFVTPSAGEHTGSGSIDLHVAENPGTEPRAAVLVIAAQLFLVEQGTCLYEVSVEGGPFGPEGAVGTIRVNTQPECPWVISTEDRKIFQLGSSSIGRSSDDIQFCLAANRKEPRTVEVRVVNEVLQVEQAGSGEGEKACAPDASTLCLVENRIEVRAAFRNMDGRSTAAQAKPVSGIAGFFSFFSPTTLELLTKVLDGRTLNGHFWLFQGALSDVAYAVTATDVETGSFQLLCNPAGTLRSRVDTEALPADPE